MNSVDRMRAGRAAKAVEDAVRSELALEQEHAQIEGMVERVYATYDTAFRKALRTNDETDWRRCDQAMQACINTSAAKRRLDQHFEEDV